MYYQLITDKSFLVPSFVHEKFMLSSGASKTIKWNQENDGGDQVNSGKYHVSLFTGSLYDTDTFVILR